MATLQPKAEIRSIKLRGSDFQLDDENLRVSGYVNETNTKSEIMYDWFDDTEFQEIMAPGVFKDAIEKSDFIDFYYEHNPSKYLASTREDSLTLEEDSKGLKMDATIVDTQWGKDAYAMIKRGAVAGMSFGFIVDGETWDTSGDIAIRTITSIQLFEVSAVRFPAYPASDISARNKAFNKLNEKLEARGYELNKVQVPKRKEARGMADISSSDFNALVNAVKDLKASVDSQTDSVSKGIDSFIEILKDEERSKAPAENAENRNSSEGDSQKEGSTKEDDSEEREKRKKEEQEKRSKVLKNLNRLKQSVK